jgi:hypothetical protein
MTAYTDKDIGKVLGKKTEFLEMERCPDKNFNGETTGYGMFVMTEIISPPDGGYEGLPVPVKHYKFVRYATRDEFLDWNSSTLTKEVGKPELD